ncbi:MAG: hypothetical protein K6E47_16735 [Lachnospiraceae bacterium]|nr:hypothetical protein [Lachnospiraceae bacterium]
MKILFKRLLPFRDFNYIMFQDAGTEHTVSAVCTDCFGAKMESVIEADGSSAEGGTVQLKGFPIREIQIIDNDGREFVLEGDDIFDYIDRKSICFYDEKADFNGFDYLHELKNAIKSEIQDCVTERYGTCIYWDKFNLSNIELASVEISNEGLKYYNIPFIASINLMTFEVVTYLGDYAVNSIRFSPESLFDWIGSFNFDEFVNVSEEEWEDYWNSYSECDAQCAKCDGLV